MEQHITPNHPGQSLDEFKRKIRIVAKQFDFLHNTYPFRVSAVEQRFSAISEAYRHMIRMEMATAV